MSQKLTSGQIHLLKLVRKGAKDDGWAPISSTVAPMFKDLVPEELCTFEPSPNGRGRAKLTPAGDGLLDALAWL